MQRVHKIALDLTNVQATDCAKAAGCARVAYNWALRWWKDAYHAWKISPEEGTGFDAETGKEIRVSNKPTENLARRHFDMIKGEEFPWMYESTKCAPQEAIRDLGRAFTNFFAGRAALPIFQSRTRKVPTTVSGSHQANIPSKTSCSESPMLVGFGCKKSCAILLLELCQ